MELLQSIGLLVRSIVLGGADFLREEYAPGLISLALLILLVAASVAFWLRIRSRISAMKWLDRAVRKHVNTQEFSAGIEQLKADIGAPTRSKPREKIAATWREFAETLIVQDDGSGPIYHNSVRPSAFFDLEDLGFGPGFWRHVPSLFVSVGLFLTFLGLVSALNSMVTESGGSIGEEQLNVLLSVASAKFIMSLTGLACSILFTLVLRSGLHDAEGMAHRLADGIEERLSFLSLEGLAAKQLAAVTEQREFLKTLGYELVAELGRPLKEIPQAVSNSIEQAMRPLLDQVGKAGTDGVGAMVESLSSRMTDDVGRALEEAGRHLAEAGDRIAELSARMDQSSSKVGDELNVALTRVSEAVAGIRDTLGEAAKDTGGTFSAGAEKLLGVMNQTLEGIRDNTSAGAAAMSAAAADLRQAGEGFRQELESAGKAGGAAARERIEAAGQEIGRIATEASAKAATDVLAPLEDIADKMAGVVGQVATASMDLRIFADGVKSGAEASVLASNAFRSASQDLTTAAAPIRSSLASVEASISALTESTTNVAVTITRSAESTARSAADALAAAQAVLGSEQKAIENALGGIAVALERLREQGARIDDIDGKLGRAFEIYTQQVAGAVDGMRQHVQDLQQTLQPSLDTLKSVVESAEEFIPKSRAR